MNIQIFILVLSLSIMSLARKVAVREDGYEPPNISIVATQKIFENLTLAKDSTVKFKAPMSIEAKNIQCVHGSGDIKNFKCSADFEIKGKMVNKKIPNSNEFFKFMDAYKAISIKEIMIGATYYEAKKISCYYSLDNQPYYKCNSGVEVFF
ncbi:MAG: hypothetical protein JNM24_18260 [Bdellovibrionaceae bacterium]|nr:hypothetical protein [Pseudobdellovibrionaceae bacterium]